jgi:cell division cycle 2-like protein
MSRKRDRWDSSSSSSEEDVDQEEETEEAFKMKKRSLDEVGSGKNYKVTNISSIGVARSCVSALHIPLLKGCRSVYDSYERIDRLDEGTYGIVWKARDLKTNEVVALKQIKFEPSLRKEGFPMAALREIGVLLALSHESIVTVKEMVIGDDFDKVFMAMEVMEMDLQQAMKQSESSPFPQAEVKSMMYQILSATQHIHEKWILHRDLKTSNILVHKSGKICLCDFGLARKYQFPLKAMTLTVITLWYRPIELLFGKNVYGPEVDMWSIG